MNRRDFLALLASGALALRAGHAFAQTADDPMTGDDPMAAAVRLSELESITYIPSLYTLYSYIHPDSAAISGRGAVIGWYQADFQPRGPQPATATGVTWLDEWTWPVNGQTYTNVAEVSYRQAFTDGSVDTDVVRLVKHEGSWRWFFGRDRKWVEEQNDRFSLILHTPQAGDAPHGFAALNALEPTLLDRLPNPWFDFSFQTQYEPVAETMLNTSQDVLLPKSRFAYWAVKRVSEFQLGSVEYGSIKEPGTQAENLLAVADLWQNQPPVEFLGWNSEPTQGPAWLHVRWPAVDVMPDAESLILVADATYLHVLMYSAQALIGISEALAGN